MKDHLERMREDLNLKGYRPRTQQAYLLAARQLTRYFDRAPDRLSEQDIRQYFLHLREERKLAQSSIKIAIYGVRFLFTQTLGLEWRIFGLLGARQPQKLPIVLSPAEVHALLRAIKNPIHCAALGAIYALGLRLGEGISLRTDHIDSPRRTVWIRDGKGGKDRGIPLPSSLLGRLRSYWRHHRPRSDLPYLFLKRNLSGPMGPSTLQRTFHRARKEAGIHKAATVHSLRHSYATHLLEAGVPIVSVQAFLGHRTLQATSRYLHVTRPAPENLQHTVERVMANI